MRFAFDEVTHQPYCPILQAIFGGDIGIGEFYDPEFWLVSPQSDPPLMLKGDSEAFTAHAALLAQHRKDNSSHAEETPLRPEQAEAFHAREQGHAHEVAALPED